MAAAAGRTLRQGVPLLVEAGTGTGKTLAYLTPVVLSGIKTIISTGTKTLQDQVSQKELPLLRQAMDPEVTWAVLKGRTNYLCLRRYQSFAAQPELGLPGVRRGLKTLAVWVRETKSGDMDQIREHGLSPALAAEVTGDSEQCLGSRCPERDRCHLVEARRQAAERRIVVVNHHLFLADLMLKATGHGEALPRYQAVVFDEAHLLPEIATQVFGVSVSSSRLNTLIRDVIREARDSPGHKATAQACAEAGQALFNRLRSLAGASPSLGLTPTTLKELAPWGRALEDALTELAGALGGSEIEESLASRATVMAMDLTAVAQPVPGQSVAWLQVRGRSLDLHLSPVEVGPHLEAALYQEHSKLVFTSATLAAGGDLEPMRRRLGLDADTLKLVVSSPFDPASQALLYVPSKMPPPGSRQFAQAVAQEVGELLKLSQGRAFVLFTTHKNLKTVSQLLGPKLDYPVLVQGQAPRMEILKRFVTSSPSVLFATASFWQGVDVPGPALSAVIVDKLPFAPPDDPLVAARMERLENEGLSGFGNLLLPEAVLSLKQGLGRLLRTPSDRGLLAVLDTRLTQKGYGKVFLKALKPVPLTRSKKEVEVFFGEA